MVKRLRRDSMLRFGSLLQAELTSGTVEYWDLINYPDIPEQTDDIEYEVKAGDRIDLLANRFYGKPSYWKVIAVANDMELLPTDLKAHQIIRIPSPRFVRTNLFNLKDKSL